MGLISVGEVLNRGLAIMISRIMPVLAVRVAAVIASMAISVVGMRSFIEKLRAAAEAAGVDGDLGEVIQALPPDALMGALSSPMLWLAVAVNVVIFLWAQAGVYLAIYPNPQTGGEGETRSLGSVMKGSLGLILPLLIINILFGIGVTIGIILLIIPGVWLAVKYGFAPLLVVVEDRSAMESFSRSSELVKDYWMPVFVRLLVVGIIAVAGNLILGFIPVVGGIAASILFPPFLNACQLAVLENLREIKGGSSA